MEVTTGSVIHAGVACKSAHSVAREMKNACAGQAFHRVDSTTWALTQAENDEPQPQVRLALGLLNLKPAPCSVST